MDSKYYAPVVIPTLNRYEHFKRCLDSLENCTGAEYTSVYVGLDYPPSEKYVEGWKKIDAYLQEKEKSNRFGLLKVYRREKNYGVKGDNTNARVIVRELRKKYSSYIISEDDNMFSPNFLEYINWGLKTYENDSSVLAICGFKRVDTSMLKNNVYKYPKFNAWGVGMWFDRRERIYSLSTIDTLKAFLNKASIFSIFKKDVLLYETIIHMIKEKSFYTDTMVYLLPKENQYCIFPKISMVRNYGHDGSGTHGCGSKESYQMYMENPMDESKTFVPEIHEDLYNPQLESIYKKAYPISLKRRLVCMFVFLWYKLFRVELR
jgi:hypothetical protein